MKQEMPWGLGLIVFGIWFVAIAGYVRHLIWVVGVLAQIDTVSAGQAVLAVGGTLAAPIGMIHGWVLLLS